MYACVGGVGQCRVSEWFDGYFYKARTEPSSPDMPAGNHARRAILWVFVEVDGDGASNDSGSVAISSELSHSMPFYCII